MAKVIEGLYYSESHEYLKVEGNIGVIGITDYAQHALGNVVYVDMPDVDDEVEAGAEFGAVESVKAASDLNSPVSGTVVEVNEALEDTPELINQDAYANWIIKVEMSDESELENLMDATAYEFALRVIRLYVFLSEERKEYVMSKQIYRSGTSIGANIAESINAQSKADFVSKLSISLKEATETKYWLELLHDSGNISDQQFDSVVNDLNVIIGSLIKTIKKTRENGI